MYMYYDSEALIFQKFLNVFIFLLLELFLLLLTLSSLWPVVVFLLVWFFLRNSMAPISPYKPDQRLIPGAVSHRQFAPHTFPQASALPACGMRPALSHPATFLWLALRRFCVVTAGRSQMPLLSWWALRPFQLSWILGVSHPMVPWSGLASGSCWLLGSQVFWHDCNILWSLTL